MKTCPYCSEEIQDEAIKCKFCDEWLNKKQANEVVKNDDVDRNLSTSQSNTSGQRKNAIIPKEIKKWNWGASLLWIWGFAHGLSGLTLIAYITTKIIPFAGIVWIIIFGIKGNEWAWRNNKYESTDQFLRKQAVWRNWGIGLISFAVIMLLIFSVAPLFN